MPDYQRRTKPLPCETRYPWETEQYSISHSESDGYAFYLEIEEEDISCTSYTHYAYYGCDCYHACLACLITISFKI